MKKSFRLSTIAIMLVLAALAGSVVSCGTIRTHGGVEFENEYYMDGHKPHHKPKKDKKPKHKKPKKNKHHHHD